VTDLANAHVLALKALEAGAASDCFNLGNGQGFSVKEVIDEAQRVTGREVPVAVGARREGDPPWLVGDATRARVTLGWAPKFAGLGQILGTAWSWHRER
jgi:UDP-glucose 4-epimerase